MPLQVVNGARTTCTMSPAQRRSDTCQCVWGGVIAITDPGQTIVDDR